MSKTEVSDSLSTCWKDNVSPTQIIRASEDRELWLHMVANVVCDGTAPKETSWYCIGIPAFPSCK